MLEWFSPLAWWRMKLKQILDIERQRGISEDHIGKLVGETSLCLGKKLKFRKLLKHIPWKKVMATSWRDISVKSTITHTDPWIQIYQVHLKIIQNLYFQIHPHDHF